MQYSRIEEIKKELDNKDKTSLLMLQDLKTFIDNKINEWGKTGETFRII